MSLVVLAGRRQPSVDAVEKFDELRERAACPIDVTRL
jgi:hypothetical protein